MEIEIKEIEPKSEQNWTKEIVLSFQMYAWKYLLLEWGD